MVFFTAFMRKTPGLAGSGAASTATNGVFFLGLYSSGAYQSAEASAEVEILSQIRVVRVDIKPKENSKDGNTIVTLRKNNVDTSVTTTIAAANTDYVTITADEIYEPGDTLSLEVDTSASTLGSFSNNWFLHYTK